MHEVPSLQENRAIASNRRRPVVPLWYRPLRPMRPDRPGPWTMWTLRTLTDASLSVASVHLGGLSAGRGTVSMGL
jgi:hypothetical protein